MTTKLRRNRPGTKRKELYDWPELPLDEMDGALSTQQHLQTLIKKDPSDIWKLVLLPDGQDKYVWIYEHLCQFIIELHRYCAFHNDVWTVENHPDMHITINGEDTVFLSSAFRPPKKVPAIDYITQTIEQTQDTLNNSTLFPSRAFIPEEGQAKFVEIYRRLARIFAFSYYHYPDYFQKFEKQYYLFTRFKTLGKYYKLIKQESLLVPEHVAEIEPLKEEQKEKEKDEDDDDDDDDDDDEEEEEN
ncbi:mob-like protein phocein [Anaeramoeba flamelloides]|uniref:Mob-like protein phocein n=1 Tax=Anaeramoeba flamelloides TaxID=1746091 RepID=A0ABQ8X7V0_9EUKA|nr:mob-like protein phocein [Anaeramoeba flamelloides]